ncbi:5-hydroxytryptamine receptor 1F-like [Hydractinia symbiolongicarpus]|uniref:5-hydroxytryptamine receptor 1F-like n=1 Tax=Hydractinia symbiolongicarpus TaxID=13093 RepID=UPI00254D1722|nr:5-hydroxytryptamine receptor 1F-like [Hydractinia symbiolongicarpus]
MWLIFLFSTIALAGIVCNVSILVSVIKYRILRKKPYSILVSLAVCDLFKVVVLVNLAIYSANDDLFNICAGTSTLGMALICTTTFHLAAESVNRCMLIVSPYRYARTVRKKHVAFIIMLLWLLPAIVTLLIPGCVFQEGWVNAMEFQSHMFGCQRVMRSNEDIFYKQNKDDDWIIAYHVLFFAFPLLVMVISYSLVLRVSYSTANDMRKTSVTSEVSSSHIVTESSYSNPIIDMVRSSFESVMIPPTIYIPEKIEHQPRGNSIAAKAAKEFRRLVKDRKREIKASKTVLIMICMFIICNAPIFSIAWIDVDKNAVNKLVKLVLICLAFSQVFIDPIVYFARLKDYKKARKKCRKYGQSMVRKASRTFSRQ